LKSTAQPINARTDLATALYGTHASSSSTAFDVLSFTTPTDDASRTHGVALIFYTGPPSAPFQSWDMISYIDAATSALTGAEKLLEDMQAGMGGVIGKCLFDPPWQCRVRAEVRCTARLVEVGDWKVVHKRVPDTGEDEDGDGDVGDGSAWRPTLIGIAE
jgi:hypothetical protein